LVVSYVSDKRLNTQMNRSWKRK